MYTETSGDDVKGKPEAMDQTDKPGTTDADGGTDGPPHTQRLSRMHRENSVCSCGAFDLMTPEDPPGDLKEEDEEEENRVEAAGEAAGQADTTSRNTGNVPIDDQDALNLSSLNLPLSSSSTTGPS